MNVFLLILLATVVFLWVARSFKNRKSGNGERNRGRPPSVNAKGATRNNRRSRFELTPLSSNDLNLQPLEQVDALKVAHPIAEPALEPKPAPSDLIVLHAMADSDKPYQGYDLLQALLANNLRFGERHIFHRYDPETGAKLPLYSVTSLNKPGTFELPKMGSFSCDGLIFFAQLKGLKDPMSAFQLMYDAATKLVATLGGYLADESRSPLTPETANRMRSQAAYYARANRVSTVAQE
jgi:cell division protein ZipA